MSFLSLRNGMRAIACSRVKPIGLLRIRVFG
jgi:hypothetical protein